ncbi:hypothetical protein MTO96_024348 [Rhipicephalus appendiculatus]
MDKLRRHRGALRSSTTRLLPEASETLLQDTLPSSADLQEHIDGLRDKDPALAELDKQIADALDSEEFDAEIVGALDYHERIVKAISRLRSAINTRAQDGSTIKETNQPRPAGVDRQYAPSVASQDTSHVIAGSRYQQRKSANVFPARAAASGAASKGTLHAVAEPQSALSATDAQDAISVLCVIWGQRGTDSPQLTATEPREAATQREKRVTTAPAGSTRLPSVLLQTATVWASGNRARVPVRLLLDTGSQRTFIREDLSQQLRLSCTGTGEVDVITFIGSNHPRHYQCRGVNVTLCGRMEPIDVDLEALEVPEVCTVNGPTLEPSVTTMMRDRNLAFADETQGDQPQDSTISVLIGSDHYWRVVTGRVERFTDTLCVVETIFGWVIQGVCANVNHHSSPRNINTTVLFLGCSDDWCNEVLPGDPSDIWRFDAIGITDGQDDVSKHPALLHFRSTFLKDGLSLENVTEQSCKSKVLGLLCDRSSDDIIITTQAVLAFISTQPSRKRTVLQAFARLFDPLGFVAPFHVTARLLFQRLWRQDIDWGEPLPPDIEKLRKWVSELPALSTIRIPRCLAVASQDHGRPTVHLFADASPHVYGVAVFVR